MFHQVFTRLRDTSAVQYLSIASTGTAALTINSIYFYGLNASNYFITRMPQNPLPVGKVDSIGVRFGPTIEGRPDATLVINTTAANNPSDTVTLFGVGILRRLVIDSAYSNTVNLNFDSVSVGYDSCLNLYARQSGGYFAITKNFIQESDYDFSMTPLNSSDSLIPPGGGTAQIQVCFKPLKPGTRLSSIRITTNIQKTFDVPPRDTSGFTVNLSGVGVPFGHMLLSGPALSDTTPIGTKICMADTLWNTGSADIDVTGYTITGPNAADFTVTGLTVPPTFDLPASANSAKYFSVCATPTMNGNETATLTVTGTNGPEGAVVTASLALDVFGTTVCDTLIVAKNFPAMTCIGSVDTATLTVSNCGDVATAYTASLAGANAAQFSIVGSNVSSSEVGGGVATFKVAYTPNATNATSTATFNIVSPPRSVTLNAARGAATIAGTGTAPGTTNVGSTSMQFGVIVTNTGSCDWTPGMPTCRSQLHLLM